MADSKSGNMSSVEGKKLINDPSHCVDDSLEGFALTNPQVKLLKGHKVVIRSDVDQLIGSNKVCLISGGGSGHEPSQAGFVGKGMLTATVSGEVFTSPPSSSILAAIRLCSSLAGVLLIVTNYTGGGSGHEPSHAGYVGNGMLSAAVCGDVFTSPPSSSILATIRTCASPGGVLLIVKNYTGDRLNFGKAAELAKDEGINVEMVIVGEDCALTSKDKSAGRRGLCGTVFIHKLAGALAEAGKPLNEIVDVVRAAAKEMGTISISLSPCSVPGQAPTFQIPDDAVEFGLGIHGEPGVTRTEMASANSLVKRMVDHLLSSQYIPSLEGKEVAVIVNNLGGTSNLELSLMAGEVVKYLVTEHVMTSLSFQTAIQRNEAKQH